MSDASDPSSSFRAFRAVRLALSLLLVLALGEGAVRAAAWLLRRDQVLRPARAGANVIYCVGDSFTYGLGVERTEAWPQQLAALLRTQGEGAEPVVRTLAEPGRSSSVAVLDVAKALKAGDARLVLIMTGWNANDGDFAAWATRRGRAVPWLTRADLWLSHSRLYRVAKQALTYRSRTLMLDNVEVIPQTYAMRLYDFRAYQEIARDNLEQIAQMCHAAGVPCAFLTYPHQALPPNPYTRIEYYHALYGRTPISDADYLVRERSPGEIAIDAVIRQVSNSEDVPLIDTQPAFEDATVTGLFQEDWHHPTERGHRLIAATVFVAIERHRLPRRHVGK